jgi:hypothetical protein
MIIDDFVANLKTGLQLLVEVTLHAIDDISFGKLKQKLHWHQCAAKGISGRCDVFHRQTLRHQLSSLRCVADHNN